MDDKGTRTETLTHVSLTSVRSGTVCRLIGVSEGGWKKRGFGKHKHRGWGERQHRPGFESKHTPDRGGILRRLLDLGLTKGCTFKIVQGSSHGPVLVEVRGTRVALGHGLARKLIVEEVPE